MALKMLDDVKFIRVTVGFGDGSGQVVPLTGVQAAYLVQQLGFRFNDETGLIEHSSDQEILRKIELQNKLLKVLSNV